MVALGRGDLLGARAVLNTSAKAIGDTAAVLAYFANFYGLYWVPDGPQQQRLLALPPAAFDDDHGGWALLRAQVYWSHGDTTSARVWADTARRVFATQLQNTPNNAVLHLNYGEALGYLGRKSEAIEQAVRGASVVPVSQNAYTGPYYQHILARIYVIVGEPRKALDCLEPLVRNPYVMSGAWLRIDPTWAPLRRNGRFERLVRDG
jgi:tetratricopeptide (TPR) repeat protein